MSKSPEITYEAKNFQSRDQLDKFLQRVLTKENKTFKGTEEELKRLNLKEGQKVYGIPVFLEVKEESKKEDVKREEVKEEKPKKTKKK